MAIGGRLIEKPDGARNVHMWDLHVERRLPRYPGDRETAKVRVAMVVEFWDDDSAVEFETKVRALLPEVEWSEVRRD